MELYYLQSRWYDPFVGRFVNADAFISTGTGILGWNMFAYCNNNPVNFRDPNGYMPQDLLNAVLAGRMTMMQAAAAMAERNRAFQRSGGSASSGTRNSRTLSRGRGPMMAGSARVPIEGPPNTTFPFPNGRGFRRFGPDGKLFQDWHNSNHGNPRHHPHVPHVHDPNDNNRNGRGGSGDALGPGRIPTQPEVAQWDDWTRGLIIVGGCLLMLLGIAKAATTGDLTGFEKGFSMAFG